MGINNLNLCTLLNIHMTFYLKSDIPDLKYAILSFKPLAYVDLMVLSIFQKAMTFDYNFSYQTNFKQIQPCFLNTFLPAYSF